MQDSNVVNSLLSAIEDLLIENAAYRTSLEVLERFLPAERMRTSELVAAAKADPRIRKEITELLAPIRSQVLEQTVADFIRLFRSGNLHN